mgnify:CR=1 FL=1|jgi:hypothetical protein
MAKHTPGPWEVLQQDFQGTLIGQRNFGAAAYDSICAKQVAWLPRSTYSPGDSHDAFMAETNANARLIAAAPELLAALEKAERALVSAYGEPVEGASLQSEAGVTAIVEVRSAIIKARGA